MLLFIVFITINHRSTRESVCCKHLENSPKGVIFLDFMCTFAMCVKAFARFFCNIGADEFLDIEKSETTKCCSETCEKYQQKYYAINVYEKSFIFSIVFSHGSCVMRFKEGLYCAC